MDNATIMVVTFNRLELTKRTLENLNKNTKYPFELVIVDNGSSDGTLDYLSTIDCIKYLYAENKGVARGRNQAMYLADRLDTDWYVTLDNDVEVPSGWLTECIDILKANRRFGQIGVNMEDKLYPIINSNGYSFQEKPNGNLGTACMVFPKSLHKMLGFFNEEYVGYAHEDADWGMRTRAAGFKMGYIKEMGNHFGVGENDVGEYRKYKDKSHKDNLKKFNINCGAYYSKKKSIYIPYVGD